MLIRDPDFNITAIKIQEIDSHSVICFDFDYSKPDKDFPNKGALRVKGGWMVLDPDHDWILREYQINASQPGKYFTVIHKTFTIREGSDHHPIIINHTEHLINKAEKPPFESVEEGEWQTVERSDVPLDEFTLSAFGLPEPPGIQVGESRLYLWIALGGIVCLGIAALTRWVSRRATAA